ncbi:glycosyltransferase [Cesiribacter sp. SM1]|uniref:glycosyltransferase n=1 Tax=Cesiribacter sp. SM1 TaxID=2861196 RepID=UPI001CD6A010|nr:glycosyltransferase [Cesiribacter sp. SM1]
MKVLHLCTFSSGGAANAAVRLHQGLMNENVISNFLYLKGEPSATEQLVIFDDYATGLVSKIQDFFNGNWFHYRVKANKRLFEIYSFPKSKYKDLAQHPLVNQADIIHLHWVSNFIDYPSFFKKLDKPVVWTLHDMNPFRGGFHYEEDAKRSSYLQEYERTLLNIKKKALAGFKQSVTFVAPSKWLLEESLHSEIGRTYPHYLIPYGIDVDVFHAYSQREVRTELGIAEHEKVLLFVSENVDNYRKGFDLLLQALPSLVDEFADLKIVAIGRGSDAIPEYVKHLGMIHEQQYLAKIYAMADAVVLPSREDNLPNVMIESLACGTPVVAFSVGGMRDVIRSGINGILAEDVSAAGLSKALSALLVNLNVYDRASIQRDAHELFSLNVQAERYIDLYRHILS